LGHFQKFVEYYLPEYVFFENVPGLQRVKSKKGPFAEFLATLARLKYNKAVGIVKALDYGVPQRRRRLVVVASRLGSICIPKPTHGDGRPNPKYSTVEDWIGDLPAIAAGQTHKTDPNHRAASLSRLNLTRIKAISPGEDRRQWPEELKLDCHSNGYKGHTDVYGRMRWDHPASGLTTRCISLSNGRFGHPDQDRAISVREAACLQTFPRDFIFKGSLNSMARQIGNAVPVILAEHFGRHFIEHFNK
jgi:DNA (cytosine-5)-methyltransferase 1